MIAVGVDTHKHDHVVCVLDAIGQVVWEHTIRASMAGYGELAESLRALPEHVVVGIEGAGSYGTGLCEYLLADGFSVVEIERPKRVNRRRHGKSDRLDARLAAKHVLSGEQLATPRAGGTRQALAALLVGYRSSTRERTRLLNELQALHTTAPMRLRERIGDGNGQQLATRLRRLRSARDAAPTERVILDVLRDLARRADELSVLAHGYKQQLEALIRTLDDELLNEPGVGPISAAKLLVCDPRRLSGEAAFARCNGTAPKPASSGKTIRHRLSRGGDRQANNALHTIALSRARYDPHTRAYLDRRISEGKTKREAMRSLKRHLSRILYKRLITINLTP
jgi:transposase